MKVIILAGGKATRLPVSCKENPKSLIKIKDKPILQYQIDILEKYGLKDIRFSLGHKAEQIINYLNGRYEYEIEPESLGTGGAIKFAAKDLKEDFLVLNGDILADFNFSEFLKFHQNHIGENAMAIKELPDTSSYGVVEFDEQNLIQNFIEKENSGSRGFINAGFYVLSPKIFENIQQDKFSIERDVFPFLAKEKKLSAFIHNGQWIDVGTEERLNWARSNFVF